MKKVTAILLLLVLLTSAISASSTVVSGGGVLDFSKISDDISPAEENVNRIAAKEIEDGYYSTWDAEEFGFDLHILYTGQLFTFVLENGTKLKASANKKLVGDDELQSLCTTIYDKLQEDFSKKYSDMPILVMICSKDFEYIYTTASNKQQ